MSTKKNVVIVGGGFGGSALAQSLDSKFNVTLVEKQTKFFINYAGLRAGVNEKWIDAVFVPYDNLLKKGKIIHDEVIEISPTEVKLKHQNESLTFDYLVIATGSSYAAPAKLSADYEEAKQQLKDNIEKVKAAKKILLVGGGSTSIEYAGEIKYLYPEKEVTIVHSGKRFLETFKPELSEKIVTKLKERNVNIIFEDRVSKPETNLEESQTYITEKGVQIEADLVYWFIGFTPENEALKTHFGDKLEHNGRIKVNQHLQVEGYENIFAIGEITSLNETKLAFFARTVHAPLVAKNIELLSQGSKQLQVHKPPPVVILVTIGPEDGACQLSFTVWGKFIVKLYKSKDIGVPDVWKRFEQKPPQLSNK